MRMFKFASYVSSLILIAVYCVFYFADKQCMVLIPYINVEFNIYILRFVFLLFTLIMGVYFLVYIFYITKSEKLNNVESIEIKNVYQQNFSFLNFIYLNLMYAAVLSFNGGINVILFIALLIIVGFGAMRDNIPYLNPLYAIFGIRIYEANILVGKATKPKKAILISKEKLCYIDDAFATGVLKDNIAFIDKIYKYV